MNAHEHYDQLFGDFGLHPQEPVAILNHAHGIHTIRRVKLNGLQDGEYKLYTSPPASKPLTDEQWHKVHRAAWEAFFGCALDSVHGQIQCAAHAAMRATEAAHGIKGNA